MGVLLLSLSFASTSYVAEGRVSSRYFLFRLALIQSFPGPNFNFTVYLGSLATAQSSLFSSTLGRCSHQILGNVCSRYHYRYRGYRLVEDFAIAPLASISLQIIKAAVLWGEICGGLSGENSNTAWLRDIVIHP